MPPRVYIETTIISYLMARPSHDIILAAHQQITDEWWHDQRTYFDLYTAQPVIDEAAEGDLEAARERLEQLAPLQLLDITEAVSNLAERLIREGPLPAQPWTPFTLLRPPCMHGLPVDLELQAPCQCGDAKQDRGGDSFKCLRATDSVYSGRIARGIEMEKWEEKIVEEVRQIREQYAARFDFDIAAICHDLRKRQEESGRHVVQLDSKRTRSRTAAAE